MGIRWTRAGIGVFDVGWGRRIQSPSTSFDVSDVLACDGRAWMHCVLSIPTLQMSLARRSPRFMITFSPLPIELVQMSLQTPSNRKHVLSPVAVGVARPIPSIQGMQ